MDKKFPPDHWLSGVLIAAISITLSYWSLTQFAAWWELNNGPLKFLQAPKPQLIILGIHAVAFRLITVNANRSATGIGFFITLFLVSIIYIFTHSKLLFVQ
jgi:hypothetical protein